MCMEDVRIARNAKAQKPVTSLDLTSGNQYFAANANRYSISGYIIVVPANDVQVLVSSTVNGVEYPLFMMNAHNQSFNVTIHDVGDVLLGNINAAAVGGGGAQLVVLSQSVFLKKNPGEE